MFSTPAKLRFRVPVVPGGEAHASELAGTRWMGASVVPDNRVGNVRDRTWLLNGLCAEMTLYEAPLRKMFPRDRGRPL